MADGPQPRTEDLPKSGEEPAVGATMEQLLKTLLKDRERRHRELREERERAIVSYEMSGSGEKGTWRPNVVDTRRKWQHCVGCNT